MTLYPHKRGIQMSATRSKQETDKKQTRNRQETDKKQTIGDTSCPYLNPSMDDVAAGDRPPHGYEGAKDCV